MEHTFFRTPTPLTSSLSYGSDWVFDGSTVITLCSDQGNDAFECIVQNFKVSRKVSLANPALFAFMSLAHTGTSYNYFSFHISLS